MSYYSKTYIKTDYQLHQSEVQTNFRKRVGLKGNKHLLLNGTDNFYVGIVENVCHYFDLNNIEWWKYKEDAVGPTDHMVSSQVQCLNYLFALREDYDAVLKLVQIFDPKIKKIVPSNIDKEPGFISFEYTYKNEKLLNENDKGSKRGKFCTSIDAFVIAQRMDKKVLIPIEWKYSESYLDGVNKALEYRKGKTRQKRYNHLITVSDQLKTFSNLADSVYYYEPFYELMRQTLLVEQMIREGLADEYMHVLVVYPENEDLLENVYSFSQSNLETTWRSCLADQNKFKVVDKNNILNLLSLLPAYSELYNYLKLRY
ncbi:hypothetical protein [Saccharicrinis sp. FJH54]|uniref:PGN_0703 family putative restriction endonuclease n=1 Tax=Saccharicrinis sp. FJH54 TaxID=3344665 RepID=UPI0035D445CC